MSPPRGSPAASTATLRSFPRTNIGAGFDVNPALIGTAVKGLPIYDVADLPEKVRELGVEIGIVAVPVEYAQDAADAIVGAG